MSPRRSPAILAGLFSIIPVTNAPHGKLIPAAREFPGLIVEVTEDEILRDPDWIHEVAMQLRLCNVSLSIDDFGTGYSSLGYLRTFPVDNLKIDRSFVKDLNAKGDGGAICAAIIALARELKLRVIAEGVENLEQVEFLRTHRCDQVQGYLMSPPVPIEELENLLRSSPDGTRLYHSTLGGGTTRVRELSVVNRS